MAYNKSYHSFFEGYAEERTCDARTGKKIIRRLYAEDYLCQDMTDQEWKKTKWISAFLVLSALPGLLCTGISTACATAYVVIPTALGIICAVFWLFYLYCYAAAPRLLKKRNIRDALNFKSVSAAYALCIGLAVIGQLIWMIDHYFYRFGLISAALGLYSVFAAVKLFWQEQNMKYKKVKNNNQIPPEAYDIKYDENREEA